MRFCEPSRKVEKKAYPLVLVDFLRQRYVPDFCGKGDSGIGNPTVVIEDRQTQKLALFTRAFRLTAMRARKYSDSSTTTLVC